jgi:hypothetical protein
LYRALDGEELDARAIGVLSDEARKAFALNGVPRFEFFKGIVFNEHKVAVLDLTEREGVCGTGKWGRI